MLWAPSRIAFFTASGLVACAMTLKPRFRQISKAARISSSSRNEWVWRSHAGPMMPPERVKLDMVDAVLDLLADGFHPTIGTVNLQRMTRGQEMSARGGQEITAGEQPRADMLSGVEGPLPCDVHEVMGAGAAQSDNAGFGKRGRKPVAEQGHLIGERHLVERQVIGMDMHVPEAGHQIPAFEIDHLRVAGAARLSVWQNGADAAILDQHGAIRPYLGLDAVDQVRMRKDCLHGGRLLGLISEIPSSTAAPKRRSTSAASEDWRRPRLPTKQPRVGRAPDRKVVGRAIG